MTKTPTPRTDAHRLMPAARYAPKDVVDADFARQLESELAAASAENERLRKELDEWKAGGTQGTIAGWRKAQKLLLADIQKLGDSVPCASGGTFKTDPPDAIIDAAIRHIDGLCCQLAEERKARGEAERLCYVPGVWRCAKCNLRLISQTLHVNLGMVSADNEPQQCANGCGPMWRVSERDAGNKAIDTAEALQDKLAELQNGIAIRKANCLLNSDMPCKALAASEQRVRELEAQKHDTSKS